MLERQSLSPTTQRLTNLKHEEQLKQKVHVDNQFFKEYAEMKNAFTRLDAKPEAVKDNIKQLLDKPLSQVMRSQSSR